MRWSSIHLLRAFAAYVVVLHHIPQFLSARDPNLIPGTFEIGAAGVDIFFAISGFVMYMSSQKKGLSALVFLKGRVARIVPMYWLVTLGVGLAAILAPFVFNSFRVQPENLLRSIFFIPVFDMEGQLRPVLYVAWTLFFEFLFYIFISFALIFKLPSPSTVGAITICLLCLLVDASDVELKSSYLILFSPIGFEFLFGVCIAALLTSNFWQASSQSMRFFVQCAALVLAAWSFSFDVTNSSLGWDRVLGWGIPSAVLVFLAAANDNIFTIVANKLPWLKSAGDCSYSLYLLHGLTFSAVYKLAAPVGISLVTLFLLATFPLLVAKLAYAYVELPASEWTRRILSVR